MVENKVVALRELLKPNKIDAFIIPSVDEFRSEVAPKHTRRLEWICGFSGSAGIAIVAHDKAAFFTDGRYTLQAKSELDNKIFSIYNFSNKTPSQWIKENLSEDQTIGYDPFLHTESEIKSYPNSKAVENLIDQIWTDRPKKTPSELRIHPTEFAGVDSKTKRQDIAKKLKNDGINSCIITDPASICWLLNIRARDLTHTPIALCYAVINDDASVYLFTDNIDINQEIKDHLGNNTSLYNRLKDLVKPLKNKIQLDSKSCPIWFSQNLPNATIIKGSDPCLLPKACKNNVEIEGAKLAHQKDGIAVSKFLTWLEENIGKRQITEIDCCEKIEEFRKQDDDFLFPSFDTIAGFASNGAIVHYRVNEASNKTLSEGELFLIDSGGQYLSGTTDITRTVAIGKPSPEHIHNFTLVLKGHIALANAVFPEGTTGTQLDVLARQFLWQEHLDYDHGTGHGVGSFLSVHEGPQRISKALSNQPLLPGMILSNEPGFYKEGEYGIRIENLVIVIEKHVQNGKKFFAFETITKAPLDTKLIDTTMLNAQEKQWLDEYQKSCP